MDSAHQHPHCSAPKAPVLRGLMFVLGALALPAALAAGPVAAPADSGAAFGLKMDLGVALGKDDCEDDYPDLVRPNGKPGTVKTASSPSTARNDAMLAKLAPAFDSKAPAKAAPAVAPVRTAAVTTAAPSVQPAAAAPVPAVASAPVATVPAAAPAQAWEIVPADKTLNAALSRWAATAGWQLLWELPVDYSVEARTTIRGSFEDAVGMVAKSMETAEIPLKAIFYEGNRVLRIVARGAE